MIFVESVWMFTFACWWYIVEWTDLQLWLLDYFESFQFEEDATLYIQKAILIFISAVMIFLSGTNNGSKSEKKMNHRIMKEMRNAIMAIECLQFLDGSSRLIHIFV